MGRRANSLDDRAKQCRAFSYARLLGNRILVGPSQNHPFQRSRFSEIIWQLGCYFKTLTMLLVGTVVYHQYGQDKHYQEQLRAACAAKGGKLALSNLCINMKPILDELTRRYVHRHKVVIW
jgi:hypothetical protein